jgi:hypothetical protein
MVQQVQSGWFDWCKNVDNSRNVKKNTKPYKYNYKC